MLSVEHSVASLVGRRSGGDGNLRDKTPTLLLLDLLAGLLLFGAGAASLIWASHFAALCER
jgi:hypothetical protein